MKKHSALLRRATESPPLMKSSLVAGVGKGNSDRESVERGHRSLGTRQEMSDDNHHAIQGVGLSYSDIRTLSATPLNVTSP